MNLLAAGIAQRPVLNRCGEVSNLYSDIRATACLIRIAKLCQVSPCNVLGDRRAHARSGPCRLWRTRSLPVLVECVDNRLRSEKALLSQLTMLTIESAQRIKEIGSVILLFINEAWNESEQLLGNQFTDPAPPFDAGSPDKAPDSLVARVSTRLRANFQYPDTVPVATR